MENKENFVSVYIIKLPAKTRFFNKNQKVFVKQLSGQLSYKVVGKLKGKFNWITAWIKLEKYSGIFELKKILVEKDFADRLDLYLEE